MQKIVIAVLAAVAVTFGVTGVAYADEKTPEPTPVAGAEVNADVKADVKLDLGARRRVDVPCTVDHNPGVPGCQNSGPFVPGHPGVGHPGFPANHRFNDRFEGRYLQLDGFNQRLDVCGNYSSYSDFAGHYGAYRGRLDGLFGNGSRWNDIRHANNCGVSNTVVTNSGDCTTISTYATDYRNSVNRWNDLARRYHGAGVWQSHRGDLDNARRDLDRYRGSYDSLRNRITSSHTSCVVPPITNIVVEAAPVNYTVAAPAAVVAPPLPAVDPAPAPAASSLPKGAPEAGDSGLAVS